MTESAEWGRSAAAELEGEGFVVRLDTARAGGISDLSFDIAVVDMENVFRPADALIVELRNSTEVPILAVTPALVREAVTLSAYSSGADQCVALTTRPRELVARVRALLRRHPPRARSREMIDVLVTDVLRVDASARTAIVNSREIALSIREFDVLVALLRRPGRVVARDELIGSAGAEGTEASLDAVMRKLRTKLEAVHERRRIVAVRGVGFRFEVE